MINHPQYANQLQCRDFQCITPEIAEFNSDLKQFRKEVPNSKTFIEKTIFSDPILERRRAAIFLLAYYQDPKEINRILTRLLDDKNYFIRHDALRVYGEMYAKSPGLQVPVTKVLVSTMACNVAERNKALLLISELAKQPDYRAELQQHAWLFIRLLNLKQPNNHLPAYAILKHISQKNYSDHDIKTWEEWAKQSKIKHKP